MKRLLVIIVLAPIAVHLLQQDLQNIRLLWGAPEKCPACKGSGMMDWGKCDACKGTGKVLK